jgi:hypothetical protein
MKVAVLLIVKVRSLNLRADCQRPKLSAWFVLGLRAGGWQFAVHFKAVSQGFIIIVAIRGIRAREFAIE